MIHFFCINKNIYLVYMNIKLISFLGVFINFLVNSQETEAQYGAIDTVSGSRFTYSLANCVKLIGMLSPRELKHIHHGNAYEAYRGSNKIKTALNCARLLGRAAV